MCLNSENGLCFSALGVGRDKKGVGCDGWTGINDNESHVVKLASTYANECFWHSWGFYEQSLL